MNSQGGVVEALSGAAGAGTRPLATLQALAEAVGALGAAQAAAAVVPDAVLPSSSAQVAQQGQMTLGQLAAEQAQRHAASTEAPPSASNFSPTVTALRHDVAPEGANTPRLPDLLAVPVTVAALHTPFATAPRSQQAEAVPARPRREPVAEDERQGSPHEEAQNDAHQLEAVPADAPDEEEPDPEAARLRAALEREGRSDALLELDRGRRLLLVLPQTGSAPVPAVAWLVGARRAQRHAARWWPGLGGSEGWLPWRVFRDGDPQLGRGLQSRAAGAACRVRLGPQPPRLPDAGAASLEIAERIRFAQGLGGQWSLLLLAAPAGWAP